jgi:hypothetical protein
MINKLDRDIFVLCCDNCNDECDEIFESFYEAVEYKKDEDNGWRTIKDRDDDWQELCPACNTPEIIRKLKGVEDL